MCHYCRTEYPRDRMLRQVCTALDQLYDEMYAAPMFPSADVIGRLRQHCQTFGEAYQRLRALSLVAGIYAFPVTPKVHKVQHIPKLATCINPVRVQVYAEESLMGSVSGTWRGSARGRYRRSVQEVVLVKQVTAMLLRFELALVS